MVRFGYTILYVADVSQSLKFYEMAFGFERRFISPENDYAELQTGGTTLALASHALAASNLKNGFRASNPQEKPFAIEIGLVTDQVEETLENALKHGATLEAECSQKPWGQTVAYLRDIDGFLIELCTPIA